MHYYNIGQQKLELMAAWGMCMNCYRTPIRLLITMSRQALI